MIKTMVLFTVFMISYMMGVQQGTNETREMLVNHGIEYHLIVCPLPGKTP